jgi:lysylphosphatidylglycerol synthetase-like protein (DUF2156 family)
VSKTTRETLFTIGYVAAGLIAVAAVGYLTFHKRFLHFPRPMLPFIVVGLIGALIYASVQMRGAGFVILMIALLFLAQVAMTPPIRPNSLMYAALYALPVGFALMAAAYVQKSLTRFKFGRFLVMGLIVGTGYALMILLFLIKSHVEIRFGTVLNQAFLGAKLGAAMGLGFELIDLIGPRPKHEPDYDRPAA